jgi:hypothetical protein
MINQATCTFYFAFEVRLIDVDWCSNPSGGRGLPLRPHIQTVIEPIFYSIKCITVRLECVEMCFHVCLYVHSTMLRNMSDFFSCFI